MRKNILSIVNDIIKESASLSGFDYMRIPKEPERLASFIKRKGGIRDVGGDVRSTLGGAKYRPGLINSNGMPLDTATHKAWEAGYFPEFGDQRPMINDLLDALADDLRGNPRYSDEDSNEVQEYQQAVGFNHQMDRENA